MDRKPSTTSPLRGPSRSRASSVTPFLAVPLDPPTGAAEAAAAAAATSFLVTGGFLVAGPYVDAPKTAASLLDLDRPCDDEGVGGSTGGGA